MKVKVYKRGVEVGWFKDIVPGANAVINACKYHKFDITEYEFRDFEDTTKIVWRGQESMLSDINKQST